MEGKKKVPVWLKLLLVLMAFILAACTAAVTLVNVQRAEADRKGVLPELFGYKYCPVADSRLEPDFPRGSLLLVRRTELYQLEEPLLVLNHAGEFPEQALQGRYLAVHMTVSHGREASGETPDGQELDFLQYEIVGRITAVIPGLGALCQLLLGARGALLFIAAPLALTVLLVLLVLHAGRKSADAVLPAGQPAIGRIPGKTPPPPGRGTSGDPYAAVFDVSSSAVGPGTDAQAPGLPKKRGWKLSGRAEEPTLSEVDRLDLFEEEPKEITAIAAVPAFPEAVEKEAPARERGEEQAARPEETAAVLKAEGAEPSASSEPEPGRDSEPRADGDTKLSQETGEVKQPEYGCEAELGDTIEFEPIRPEMLKAALSRQKAQQAAPPAGGDAAVAIYREGERESAAFTPPYLRRPIGDSLAEFKAFLMESQPPAQTDVPPSAPLPGPDGEESGQLEQISSFDLDQAIEEIKRKNALYEKSLRRDRAPILPEEFQPELLAEGEKPVEEAAAPAEAKRRDHPASHRWKGVYHPESFYEANACRSKPPSLSADEIIRLHRQDYVDRRFRPSFITVVGEEEEGGLRFEGESGRGYHNRNDNDEL